MERGEEMRWSRLRWSNKISGEAGAAAQGIYAFLFEVKISACPPSWNFTRSRESQERRPVPRTTLRQTDGACGADLRQGGKTDCQRGRSVNFVLLRASRVDLPTKYQTAAPHISTQSLPQKRQGGKTLVGEFHMAEAHVLVIKSFHS